MTIPFIAVEGPIGVGKTTLSRSIAESQNFQLLKEIVEENPFLSKFYDDIEAWSFQTEMFFLCNRYKQLSDIKKEILSSNTPVVADYHVFKNLIFAKRTLEQNEYEKYEEIYKILTRDMPAPNIIVYLYASQETLMKRIALRGREFEKNMDPAYLTQLANDYEMFINIFEEANPHIPVLRFNGDHLDFVNKKEDMEYVLTSIVEVIQGVQER
ncbi:deoxynucleoside kinase [Sporosarcina pasteurii]|uniref:Deoxyguanosine kinase n=1 Tax=Sporosarcina pasteurii TaxID=1474 RepID=A0A380BCG3_SPOPA|nr:deoxynucleoside kinase [Sporosarcina pasteurii]MDS9473366.1 deoxynucleoside kinase [Sporosarcina pasteurii]QBQ06555.1 deoxynucleoside kinase [Sporosarcina pasteurii]SUI98039.1 Deoxyguanosine kinase [Sporosarcina pasteurii]